MASVPVTPKSSRPIESGVPEPLASPPRTVTFRAVTIGLFLEVVNAFWVVMMERIRYSAHPTTISLFFNCVFFLVVLTGINSIVARFRPRWALVQGELLLIYAMLCIGSCMAAHDMGQILVPTLVWPFAQNNNSNQYLALFGRFLPKWAMMTDVHAAKDYFGGRGTLYTREHLLAWLAPTLIWTAFITVLLFVMQCVNSLIRKQWTDNERLTYPLARIPLEITDTMPGGRKRGEASLVKNRLFWAGFVLAATIDTTNSLNYYFPSIPPILTPGNGQGFFDAGQWLTTKPWSAVGWTPLSFYPFVIGLGMLMPMDFLFSAWFFYLTWKLQSVMVVANAWDSDPRMPYANYQAFGAYMLFFASTLWLSRQYFQKVVRCALGKPTDISDKDEPLSYRGAFLGLALGLVALIAFSMALGLSWWLAFAFFFIYLALALAITRMRAELGTPVHDLHFTGPDWALTDLIGTRAIGASGLAVFSLFFWFNRAYRAHPMPHQLEAFKMAEATGARREMRGWFWVLLLAGAVGMICAFWAMLHLNYVYGATAKASGTFGAEAWDRYAGWIKQPKTGSPQVGAAIIIGFLFAAFLQAMRVRFTWWPFHPLAYAVSGSWEMNLLWMPLLIAWIIKSILLRYGGGMKTYQASLPFFYGLILGQFVPGSLLNIWGILTANPTYQFWQ
jgi:hypothetical protein